MLLNNFSLKRDLLRRCFRNYKLKGVSSKYPNLIGGFTDNNKETLRSFEANVAVTFAFKVNYRLFESLESKASKLTQ